MSQLSQELNRYLSIRRNLGYSLITTEQILRGFIAFAEQEGVEYVGPELFLRWHDAFGQANQQTWSRRLGIIRIFAKWLHGINPKHTVPSAELIPAHYRRTRPYIYSKEEIRSIVSTAAILPSIDGIRGITYSTLFGLIAVTGLRINEALSLNTTDIDLEAGVITLRRGKRGKSRLLPLSSSTTAKLAEFVKTRNRLLGASPEAFFVSSQGKRLSDCNARYQFALVCQMIGLRATEKFHRHGRGPRIHDLRHSFAVHTLVNWYQMGKDPAQEMLKLTTYLGHNKPEHTYWYIEAIPELLDLASQRAMKGVQP